MDRARDHKGEAMRLQEAMNLEVSKRLGVEVGFIYVNLADWETLTNEGGYSHEDCIQVLSERGSKGISEAARDVRMGLWMF